MSRIGNKPIAIPSGVDVQIKDSVMNVKGPKGEVQVQLNDRIKIEKDKTQIVCKRTSEEKSDRALHGAIRALIANAVEGVTQGFKKEFEIVGIGYRAALEKKKLIFTVGYSHQVELELPADLQVAFDEKNKNKFTVTGADKHRVGQFATHIRNVRPPDVYKGKGIKYADEQLKLKEGKKKA
ncbi:MAG TPA: 50S ribosomal protein L6 [Acidobacteriota bacterium]|nr:50S ribosomal protein L6 [Acidobacteriota bacterium]